MSISAASGQIVSEQDRIRVSPHRMWAVSMLLFSLGFVVFGAWLFSLFIQDWNDSKLMKAVWVGPLCVVLFGWIAWLMLLRLRTGYGTYVGPEGLTIPGPTFTPKLIPWGDIEAITSFKIRSNGFTGIRLKTYAHLIPQYSAKEANILLRRNRWLGRAVRVTAPMAIVQTGIDEAMAATGDWKGLSEYFAGQRQAYGCDFMLSAIDRDRNAADFATYLEAFREKYSRVQQKVNVSDA